VRNPERDKSPREGIAQPVQGRNSIERSNPWCLNTKSIGPDRSLSRESARPIKLCEAGADCRFLAELISKPEAWSNIVEVTVELGTVVPVHANEAQSAFEIAITGDPGRQR
jgi:hypothetical protein